MKSIDPSDLQPHPLLTHIPAPAKDDPAVCACADAIREQSGFLQPLIIDESNQLLTDDSRLRWMAAKRMGLAEVPVMVQPAAMAPVIMLNALLHRSHYTKSALAYLSIPLLKPAFDAGRARKAEILRAGGTIGHSVTYAPTWEDMAEKVGVSKGLFVAAKKVRDEFAKDRKKYTFIIEGGENDGAEVQQTLKEHFEPKLLRQQVDSEHAAERPIGLGGVMKAIGSIRTTKGAPKQTNGQLELFTGGLDLLSKRWGYWHDLDDDDKSVARAKIHKWVDAMPDEVREELARALQSTTKRGR